METTHHQEPSDHDLLAGTAAGEAKAFEALYNRYHVRIYHYLRMRTHDDTLAEEVLAEVMVAVWKGAGNFKGGSQVSTWIFGIARNKVLDAFRQRTRAESKTVELVDEGEVPDPVENPEEQVDQKTTGALVHKALTKLSQEHQEIIYLAFYEEMPYQDIATMINISVSTVKTRVFYAKQKLKVALGTLGVE